MKNTFGRLAICGLLAVAVAGAPLCGFAQEKKEKAPAEKKQGPGGEKKKGQPPIRGKIANVDKTAKTVTIGQTVIQITSETKIEKAGKPATLDDAVVGDEAMARIKKTEDGKTEALGLRIGPRPEGEAKKGDGKKGEGKKKEN